MKTNFKEYLEKKNAQKQIDKLAKNNSGKKIVLYGAGFFASDLLRHYDLSGLNIIGIADNKFINETEGDFYGYPKLSPEDLLETEFDLLLITVYDDTNVKIYLRDELFEDAKDKRKVKSLIKMGLFEYIKEVIKGEL